MAKNRMFLFVLGLHVLLLFSIQYILVNLLDQWSSDTRSIRYLILYDNCRSIRCEITTWNCVSTSQCKICKQYAYGYISTDCLIHTTSTKKKKKQTNQLLQYYLLVIFLSKAWVVQNRASLPPPLLIYVDSYKVRNYHTWILSNL